MIQQHIYRRDKAGYRTAAASAGLTGSVWLSLLEQQTMLRCQPDPPAPVYYQYPLGMGLVFSRCVVDPNGARGSCLVHQLVANEPEDIEALAALRPFSTAVFQDACAGREGEIIPLPTLGPETLADPSLLRTGFRLIDNLFDEPLLAALIQALQTAAQDKRQMVHLILDGDAAAVSEQGRLLMDMLMRALSPQDMRRASFCTLMAPGETAMSYTACVSTREAADRAPGASCVRFDLPARACAWPEGAPPVDERCRELARALLAHDLNWVDRARLDGRAAPLSAAQPIRLEMPDFEKGMSLTQYMEDWAEAMETRRAALNEEAFREFAAGEWPLLTERVVRAADLMPEGAFTRQLYGCVRSLCKGRRGEALGMSRQNLADLVVVLLDSIHWDDVDLSNPRTVQFIRAVTGYANLLDGAACEQSCLTACRAVHAMLDAPMVHMPAGLDDLARLSEEDPALFMQVQACARRYVAGCCQASREGREEFGLVDDMLMGTAVTGSVRFTGGIPDFRQTEKLRETVRQAGGARAARRFEAQLDRLRRRMHASRANHARRREMRLMLAGSLLLTLVIAAVIVGYFVFIR